MDDAMPPVLPLDLIAAKLRTQVYDMEEGSYGFESSDPDFGIEIVKVDVPKKDGGLGLDLVGVLRGKGGLGLTLVDRVTEGGNAAATNKIMPGDTLTYVGVEPDRMTRVEALSLERTVEAIRDYADDDEVTLVLKRLVRRATIKCVVQMPSGETTEISCRAGTNLRGELLRGRAELYAEGTERYDQRFLQGDCRGEGVCGTCIVKVLSGSELLTDQGTVEEDALKGAPFSWRLACQTVVGRDNVPGELRLRLQPQMGSDGKVDNEFRRGQW